MCTGNRCRSPSAALLLNQQLGDIGRDDVPVRSAGTVGGDVGPPRPLVLESRAFGIDLGPHVPRRVDPGTIGAADLVVGLAREHVRLMVLAVPTAFPKTFTLREIVRRGLRTGPRHDTVDLGVWLAHLHDGRRHADLMGDSPEDDVIDPLGGSRDDYRRMLTDLSALTKTLCDLAWPRGEFGEPRDDEGATDLITAPHRDHSRIAERSSRLRRKKSRCCEHALCSDGRTGRLFRQNGIQAITSMRRPVPSWAPPNRRWAPFACRWAVHAATKASRTSSGAAPRGGSATSVMTSPNSEHSARRRSSRPSGVRLLARMGAPCSIAKLSSGHISNTRDWSAGDMKPSTSSTFGKMLKSCFDSFLPHAWTERSHASS